MVRAAQCRTAPAGHFSAWRRGGIHDAGLAGATTDGKRGLFIVGATYALSKRTNFYADVDYARFKDGLAGSGSNPSTGQLPLASPSGQDRMVGFSVGVNHLF